MINESSTSTARDDALPPAEYFHSAHGKLALVTANIWQRFPPAKLCHKHKYIFAEGLFFFTCTLQFSVEVFCKVKCSGVYRRQNNSIVFILH